jgi:NADPH2:quinone reductase
MRVIQLDRTGGPEVLTLAERPLPEPGPGQIRIWHGAIGLNYIDTYFRRGVYPTPLPTVLGQEAAGVVEAIGEGVDRFKLGDRVAYAGAAGAYAEANIVLAAKAVRLPDSIDVETAAAVLLKGLTVEMLVRRIRPLQGGETVLVHAAAGGVGSMLVQWAKALGATVIGTAGSPDKADLARGHGADHVILYRDEPVAERVRELTGGQGVAVAYDGVGADTTAASLKSLAKRGWLIVYGAASGPAPAVDPLDLMRGGSLFLTRPGLFDYIADPAELDAAASELFAAIASGAIKPQVGQRFALADAADAHRALESRATAGSTLLIP